VKVLTILLPVIVAALASCTSAGGVAAMGSGERWTPTCSAYYSGTNMPGGCSGYRWH
jgi:hypothetical protein